MRAAGSLSPPSDTSAQPRAAGFPSRKKTHTEIITLNNNKLRGMEKKKLKNFNQIIVEPVKVHIIIIYS